MKILDVPQSGSVAGVTSSRNRFGQYRRTRAVPVNPNTTAQQSARDRLSAFSAGWRALTDLQRAAWESYALEHPVTDSLGQVSTLSGSQVYVGVNAAMFAAGFAAGVVVPPVGALPDPPVISLDDVTAAAFDMTSVPSPLPALTRQVFEFSPPLSAGRSFNADFRIVLTVAPAGEPEVTSAGLAAKYGTLAVGQKYFFRSRLVTSTGKVSTYASGSFILT